MNPSNRLDSNLSLRRVIGRALRRSLSALPVDVRDLFFRITSEQASVRAAHLSCLSSVQGALELAKENGFRPRAIVDVGAYVGNWSRMARQLFPGVRLVMIDGNPENEQALRGAVQTIGSEGKHFIALLGPEEREEVTLFQNATGTSVLRELTTLSARPVQVPMCTLDRLLEAESLRGPLLLKLDVQGFELEVLRGGPDTLREAELVVLEASTLPFNENAPLFAEVVGFMANSGYAVYDLCGQVRRDSDHALFQMDVLFSRNDSELRRHKKFWNSEP
jgi:FkbM family methyltransferase